MSSNSAPIASLLVPVRDHGSAVALDSRLHSDMHLVFSVLKRDAALARQIRADHGGPVRRVLMVYKYRGSDGCLRAAWRWQSLERAALLRRVRAYYGKRPLFDTVLADGGLVCTVIDGCVWGCPENTFRFNIEWDDGPAAAPPPRPPL